MVFAVLTFDHKVALLDEGIDGAFTERDLYMRALLYDHLWLLKWERAAVYQGGL